MSQIATRSHIKRAISVDYNLLVINPKLSKQWHPYKNGLQKPEHFSPKSGKTVWWQCLLCQYEWRATIIDRNNGNGCSACSGRVVTDKNRFTLLYPDVAKEWHLIKNGSLKPEDYSFGSNNDVWWQCSKCTHEWSAKISSRCTGNGCPGCSGKVVTPYNNLSVMNTKLSKEWHPDKNGTLTPADVTPGMDLRVWWKCSKGHEWQASISSRSAGAGCTKCNNGHQTSFPEQVIFYYISLLFPKAMNRYRFMDQYEMDIFIPELNLGIEYDGYMFHKDKIDADYHKTVLINKLGIPLLRIREENLTDIILLLCDNMKGNRRYSQKTLKSMMLGIFDYIETKYPLIFTKDFMHRIDEMKAQLALDDLHDVIMPLLKKLAQSLVDTHPKLCKEWHYDKNMGLLPENFTHGMNKKVWWLCKKCKHEWRASISNRAKGQKCKACSGKIATITHNLKIKFPILSSEWDYEKNVGLRPEMFVPGSGKWVWWQCKNGHSWRATIQSRTKLAVSICRDCRQQVKTI